MLKEKLSNFKNKVANNPSFTVKEQVGYASGIFGNSMTQDSVETYGDKFMRNFMGIENKHMTIMGNIHTVFNIINPTIAGSIIDRPVAPNRKTPTKHMLQITPIPFALMAVLLFIAPFSDPFKNFIWAILLKLVYNTVDNFYDMSLQTMSLRMTNNAKDRKNFYTIATFASALGSMLPGWVIPIIIGRTDDPNMQKWLYFCVALVFAVLGVITMYAPYFTLEEKIRINQRPEKQKIIWDRQTISTMLHSRSFVVMQLGIFFETIRQISYELLPYVYDDTFDDYGMKAVIDAISGGLSYAGLAAVPFITNAVSARTLISGGYAFTGTFYVIMALFAINFNIDKIRKSRYLIGILIGIAGMPNNAISASKKVVLGDATDYMEWYSEKHFGRAIRSEGLVIATQSLLGNVYKFIRTNIYNGAFSLIDYKPGKLDPKTNKVVKAVQSTRTLKGIYLAFTLCGVIGNFLASAVYLFDNYTGKRKEAILDELAQLRAAREAAIAETAEA